jgi:microcin C transport system substrate-binding protein
MRFLRPASLLIYGLLAFPLQADAPATADAASYGLSLWGKLKYKEGFQHFDYVDPKAPRGGELRTAAEGSFDSVNFFIVKGNKAPGSGTIFESLMVGSLDEPQSMYGLVARSATLSQDRKTIDFALRPEARFQDGSPLRAEDVVFSLERFQKDADPSYRILYAPMRAQALDALHVRFTFSDTSKRDLPLVAASMPIFSKAWYSKHSFTETTLEPPLASGPYRIGKVDAGRSITYERVKDYWGDKLPVNVGQNNFDRIRYDMYRDDTVAIEALKAHNYDFREENIARAWATAYDGTALQSGQLKKTVIPHRIPQGMQAFVFNLRREKFQDRRVREAIGLTLDFAWMNKAMFYSGYKRDTSFFQNTEFAASGLPSAAEIKLLMPHRGELPAALFTQPFALPQTDGSGDDRAQILKADRLLTEAGWIVKDGVRVNARTGAPLTFEFMLHSPAFERVVAPMRRHLQQLGVNASIRVIDDAQYVKRLETFDYDVMIDVFNRGVFYPGSEQLGYWHSSLANQEGSNNYSGLKSPVVDDLLAHITSAQTEEELITAGRALDRVLLWEHYVIPHWYVGAFRIAYWDKFGMPRVRPDYSLGIQTWWEKKP